MLVLTTKGAEVGLDDNGTPILSVRGDEQPLTRAAIEELIGPQFTRSTGKPGTALPDVGTAPRSRDVMDSLNDQNDFERDRKAILAEVAKRNSR